MADIIQFRRGTAAAWTTANPILADGEMGFETDTRKQKIGDGVTAWSSLAYVGGAVDPDALHVSQRLAEFNTQIARSQARTNLELENIDCGTFN